MLELDPKTFFQTHYDLMQIFASLINNKKNLKILLQPQAP